MSPYPHNAIPNILSPDEYFPALLHQSPAPADTFPPLTMSKNSANIH